MIFGYKKISQSGQPLQSRNSDMATRVAKNRKKASRKGRCSCSRCGRYQGDVSEKAPSFSLNDSTATFTLCAECASPARPEEIFGWVLLHVFDRSGYNQEVDFETLQKSIEDYCQRAMVFEVVDDE